MKNRIEAFCRGEEGASAIEYAFVAGLVSVAIFVSLITLGNTIEMMYGAVAGDVTNSVGSGD